MLHTRFAHPQFRLAVFPLLNSHGWLLAMYWDRRALEPAPCEVSQEGSQRERAQKKSDGRTARREGVAEVRGKPGEGAVVSFGGCEQRQGR